MIALGGLSYGAGLAFGSKPGINFGVGTAPPFGDITRTVAPDQSGLLYNWPVPLLVSPEQPPTLTKMAGDANLTFAFVSPNVAISATGPLGATTQFITLRAVSAIDGTVVQATIVFVRSDQLLWNDSAAWSDADNWSQAT